MTPEEIEATAQRTAALLIDPAATAAPLVASAFAAPACTCHLLASDGDLLPAPIVAPIVEGVTADAVARSDAPAALAPEDGMAPMPMWEAECVELKSRIGALENRLAGLESDISRILVESTHLLTLG